MKRIVRTAVCLVLVAFAVALGTGAVSADGGGTIQPQSSYWCRGC
ncbi:MAG: hypothetical protein KatS3mg059_0979 [Thermomicrobiales bacterium]|nr:MAG: hypothetical protein KatS3mg059_0979 [Thermomicrobiales bacterium]